MQDMAFPRSVLVVDDDSSVTRLLQQLLASRGYPVTVVKTGEEGLQLMERQNFGCLLVDRSLPKMDGLAVMRAARQLQPYCGCILITAFASLESALEALRLGAADYIEKPFSELNLVVQKVEHAIRQKEAEFERDHLVEQVKLLQSDLAARDAKIQELSTHLKTKTSKPTVKIEMASVAEYARERNDRLALTIHAETILNHVRGIRFNEDAPASAAKEALAGIAKRIEAHLALLRGEQQ